MTAQIDIRPIALSDAAALAAIYNYYIRETIITFELEEIDEDEMSKRIEEIAASYPFIVAERNGEVLGYAYANQWRKRCAYDDAVETTVYLDKDATGQGVGTALYTSLLKKLKECDFTTAIGGVSLPNAGSIKLHEKCGFEKVAEFINVGYKFGERINVGYWQVQL